MLAIKYYHPRQNLNAAQQQYQALEKYQSLSSTGRDHDFRVPKVYSFDRGQRLLIMEWLNGKNLHQRLWSSPEFLQSKQIALKRCGQWLRTFHQQHLLPDSPVLTNIYLKSIRNSLLTRQDMGLSIDNLCVEFRKTYELLTKLIQRHPEIKDTRATLHGDFTPHNIIIGKDTTVAVDIWATVHNPILMDISRMLVYLTIAYPLLILRKPVFDSHGQLNKTLAPLIEGYGNDLVNPFSLHFKIVLLSEYLRRWLVIEGRETTAVSQFTDKFQVLQIRKNLHALMAQIADN